LPEYFEQHGLVNVEVDNRIFLKELLPFQLDTALMASEEISYKALDSIRNESEERCGELISQALFKDK